MVPCYVEGAFRAWPKGRRLPRPRKVRLIMGAARRFEGEEAGAIATDLRAAVEALRENHGSG